MLLLNSSKFFHVHSFCFNAQSFSIPQFWCYFIRLISFECPFWFSIWWSLCLHPKRIILPLIAISWCRNIWNTRLWKVFKRFPHWWIEKPLKCIGFIKTSEKDKKKNIKRKYGGEEVDRITPKTVELLLNWFHSLSAQSNGRTLCLWL